MPPRPKNWQKLMISGRHFSESTRSSRPSRTRSSARWTRRMRTSKSGETPSPVGIVFLEQVRSREDGLHLDRTLGHPRRPHV